MWPFDSILFTQGILPFLLIFVLIFAILQKSKLLGEGKAQIDALVSLVIALILIGAPGPRSIVVDLMPWLAVGVAILLVFFLLYGFVVGDLSSVAPWMKITFGILAGLFTIGVILYVTGLWGNVEGWFSGDGGGEVWGGIILIIIIAGALAVAIATGKKGGTT